MNWIFCWLPFESSSTLRSRYSGIRKRSSQSSISRARVGVGHAVQRREEAELLADLHLRVEAALLGEVAPGAARQRGVLGAHPGDAAGIGAEDVEHDPHRGRLAGAVRAEQPEDPARLDREARLVEGDDVTESLADGVEDEGHDWSAAHAAG